MLLRRVSRRVALMLVALLVALTGLPPALPQGARPLFAAGPAGPLQRTLPAPAPAPPVSALPPADFVPAPILDAAAAEHLAAEQAANAAQSHLSFVPNHGQIDAQVRFQTHGSAGGLFFTDAGLVVSMPLSATPDLARDRAGVPEGDGLPDPQDTLPTRVVTATAARISFPGANPAPVVDGLKPLPGVVNFFRGNDPALWQTQIPTYAGVAYRELYPGIDLHYEGADGQVKGTYYVAPGADPTAIRWRYEGATGVALSPTSGALEVTLDYGTLPLVPEDQPRLTEAAPVAWQIIAGVQQPVPVSFALDGQAGARFVLGAYDATQPLIIDPYLSFSTYLGGAGASGSDDDYAEAVAVDAAAYPYVAGRTTSASFPTQYALYTDQAVEDAFVTKLENDGTTLRYATYLGGNDADKAYALAVNQQGQVFITGNTQSSDFPTVNAYDSSRGGTTDAFVVGLSSGGGSLLFSTYLGGANHWDFGTGIQVGNDGNVYVGGYTYATDFPATVGDTVHTPSGVDSFVTGWTTSGAYRFGTFYSGTANYTRADALAVDENGHLIIVGNTNSNSLTAASTGAYGSITGSWDAFVAKLDTSGNKLVYTYLGGSNEDYAYGVAVDYVGNVYVVGETESATTPFPTASGAYPSYNGGLTDAFVTKLTPALALTWSNFLGGSSPDEALDVAVDAEGNATVVGTTSSGHTATTPFPLANALDTTYGGNSDVFVTTFTPAGTGLVQSTYLGGGNIDEAHGVALGPGGNPFVVGATLSQSTTPYPTTTGAYQTTKSSTSTSNYDAFLSKLILSELLADQNRYPCPCEAQPEAGAGVNTATGNHWETMTDLVDTRPGPVLAFSRIYHSQAITQTGTVLGAGWQHPYSAKLVTETMPDGSSGKVVVSPEGNRLRFKLELSGAYTGWPGVPGTLSVGVSTSTWTKLDNSQLVFDTTSGRLTSVVDPQGGSLTLTYNGSNELTTVQDDDNSDRVLNLTYTSGKITGVNDGHGRSVSYAYNGNDLEFVTDVMNHTTAYSYTGSLLTRTTNHLGQVLRQTGYTGSGLTAKATSQSFLDGRSVAFSYLTDRTDVTTTGSGGLSQVEKIYFDQAHTMTKRVVSNRTVGQSVFGGHYLPHARTDGLGHATSAEFLNRGLPVKVTNALGEIVKASYDSSNRPITITDALGRLTTFVYTGTNLLWRQTTGITTTSSVSFTSIYSYTNEGHLQYMRDPQGSVTKYTADATGAKQGLAHTVVSGFNTATPVTTTYGFDSVGRVVTTTLNVGTTNAISTVVRYNADNTVYEQVENYRDGSYSAAQPGADLITRTAYDSIGRPITVTTAYGSPYATTSVTRYNAKGQVSETIQNYQDGSFSKANPDQDVRTLYGYDGLGRSSLVTETGILTGTFNTTTLQFSDITTRTTRTEYDTLSRPVTVTLNYVSGQPIYSANPPTGRPDVNLQRITSYDLAGNVTGQRDELGRWTMSEYDALNRVTRTIQNYENGNPLTINAGNTSWATLNTTDLIAVTVYEGDQVARTIDNYVDGTFTATEPITDRITLYSYGAHSQPITTTVNYTSTVTTRTDLNLISVTAYDTRGRAIGQRDPLGRWANTHYDSDGRVDVTTQNCRDGSNNAVSSGCATFSSANADRNVTSTTQYDGQGRAYQQVDVLGVVTHTDYDSQGRGYQTIQNYVAPGTPTTAMTNVTTLQQYDHVGRTVIMTDALQAMTRYGYDRLGHTVIMTDSMNRVTRYGYDGQGAQRWTRMPDGRFSVTLIDGLGRVTRSVTNYENGTVTGADGTDRDLVSLTVYDGAGRVLTSTNALTVSTTYRYDLRDQLVAVIENDQASCGGGATDCDVTTTYTYDRAGNRSALTDARGNTRRWTYDAAGRMTASTDARSRVTSMEYDQGSRLTKKVDPRGTSFDVTYAYDNLDRTVTISATSMTQAITQTYNALGWRTSLGDTTGTTVFTYDNLGRMTRVVAPTTGTVQYSYDAGGRRTSLTYPDTTQVLYGYFASGQLKAVTETSTLLASYTYDAVGRLDTLTRANGVTSSYGYDNADRLTSERHQVASGFLQRSSYTLDRTGQRTALAETRLITDTNNLVAAETRTTTYGYDSVDRLTSATEASGTSWAYTYDLAGNRLSAEVNNVVVGAWVYDAADQVITETVSNTPYRYDATGNLTSTVGSTFTYDALGRLTSGTTGGTTSTYSYNGDGTLVRQVTGGTTTNYTQDLQAGLSQVLIQSVGGTATRYTYGHDRLAGTTGGTRTWELHDPLGSVRLTANNSGLLQTALRYDPSGIPVSGTPAPFGFTGELVDANTDLNYHRARWYNPGLGSFLGRDPYQGDPKTPYSQHYYQYGYSNPVRYTDPSGKFVTNPSNTNQATEELERISDVVSVFDIICSYAGSNYALEDTSIQGEIRFTSQDETFNGYKYNGEAWDPYTMTIVFAAVKRIVRTIGIKATKKVLGLDRGLTFNKIRHDYSSGSGVWPGLYQSDTNTIQLEFYDTAEKMIELSIHEMGHAVDFNVSKVKGRYYSQSDGWQKEFWGNPDGSPTEYGNVKKSPDTNSSEDFADTFTWMVEEKNKDIGSGGFSRATNDPSDARRILLATAIMVATFS